jgi:uncharacterized phage-associated protein
MPRGPRGDTRPDRDIGQTLHVRLPKTVTPLKIQKLVYCLHGWHLATRDSPVVGELFEAWPYGPVLSSIYHEFKKNGKNSIEEYAREIDP